MESQTISQYRIITTNPGQLLRAYADLVAYDNRQVSSGYHFIIQECNFYWEICRCLVGYE